MISELKWCIRKYLVNRKASSKRGIRAQKGHKICRKQVAKWEANHTLSAITLNVNTLNTPMKRE